VVAHAAIRGVRRHQRVQGTSVTAEMVHVGPAAEAPCSVSEEDVLSVAPGPMDEVSVPIVELFHEATGEDAREGSKVGEHQIGRTVAVFGAVAILRASRHTVVAKRVAKALLVAVQAWTGSGIVREAGFLGNAANELFEKRVELVVEEVVVEGDYDIVPSGGCGEEARRSERLGPGTKHVFNHWLALRPGELWPNA